MDTLTFLLINKINFQGIRHAYFYWLKLIRLATVQILPTSLITKHTRNLPLKDAAVS
jgi:hypothetical protein